MQLCARRCKDEDVVFPTARRRFFAHGRRSACAKKRFSRASSGRFGLSSPPAKNFSISPSGKSPLAFGPSRAHQEGRTRRHERGARDAMDANCVARRAACFADGEVVWSWCLDAGIKPCGMFREATVTNKPDHRREREGNRKTIAQGMPECFGLPVVTSSLCAFTFCTQGCGCGLSTRHSLRPLFSGVKEFCARLGRLRAARRRMHAWNVRGCLKSSNLFTSSRASEARPGTHNHRCLCCAKLGTAALIGISGYGSPLSLGRRRGEGGNGAAGDLPASLLHYPPRGCVARQEPYIPGALSIL
jgi:hypothetical protein